MSADSTRLTLTESTSSHSPPIQASSRTYDMTQECPGRYGCRNPRPGARRAQGVRKDAAGSARSTL
ncbi:hypothetical protein JCM4914_70830 [Streptomyces platensis subsp. malvinus]